MKLPPARGGAALTGGIAKPSKRFRAFFLISLKSGQVRYDEVACFGRVGAAQRLFENWESLF